MAEQEKNMDIHSKVVEVIATTYNKGTGIVDDPVRRATSYYSLQGKFLFELDEYDEAIETDKKLREKFSKMVNS